MTLILALVAATAGCTSTTKVTDAEVREIAVTLDYGDSSSVTLLNKAWQASADKNYAEVFAFTQRCVELHGAEGKRMNDALTDFEPEPTAASLWALNDVGTCLFVMAAAHVELEQYPQAVEAYTKLADDYTYAQCWDPKGWFWRPAEEARMSADYYDKF